MNNSIRSLVNDYHKYFSTVVPKGVNRQLYMHLKYAVRDELYRYCDEEGYDPLLVEKVATHNFLRQDHETIKNKIEMYME